MSDHELLALALDRASLTEEARQSLEEELRTRGISKGYVAKVQGRMERAKASRDRVLRETMDALKPTRAGAISWLGISVARILPVLAGAASYFGLRYLLQHCFSKPVEHSDGIAAIAAIFVVLASFLFSARIIWRSKSD